MCKIFPAPLRNSIGVGLTISIGVGFIFGVTPMEFRRGGYPEFHRGAPSVKHRNRAIDRHNKAIALCLSVAALLPDCSPEAKSGQQESNKMHASREHIPQIAARSPGMSTSTHRPAFHGTHPPPSARPGLLSTSTHPASRAGFFPRGRISPGDEHLVHTCRNIGPRPRRNAINSMVHTRLESASETRRIAP